MAIIYVNNERHEVPEGGNLLDACLALGYDIPYFCWHPALGSVGACRQCAVKKFRDEQDTAGRIVMSCMEPVADGLRVSIDDPDALRFRASIIEWLMANHPHDCPVCDEGGECHLQDMTVMTGHNYRRYRFKKRTHRNQYLGPFINHEMNRCIQCYRCVRFYRDYAGGRDLDAFSSHHHVYFGRHEAGVLESEFSGNLVEVCPTGVFTDKTLKKHFTRKWDLQSAPSLCVHCGLGCNIAAGERYGSLRRVLGRYNGAVNGYFLCDRGRFGYEFVSSAARVRRPLVRRQEADRDTVIRELREALSVGKILGIGSPRASVESNFALRKLVGPENFYAGIAGQDHRLLAAAADMMRGGCAAFPSLRETEKADAVLVLGEDVAGTAPLLALALRQSTKNRAAGGLAGIKVPAWDSRALNEAAREEPGPLFIATPLPTRLDDAATLVYRAAPAEIARLGRAIAHALDGSRPPVPGLDEGAQMTAELIARRLQEAARPLIVSGAGCRSDDVVMAAAGIAGALSAMKPGAGLFLAAPECDSMGLVLLGEKPLEEAFRRAEGGEYLTAVILENDLYRRAPGSQVDRFLAGCENVIVLDSIHTPTTAKAGIVLPAATFAEGEGTLVNNEGRAQRFYRVMDPAGEIRDSWRWIADMMESAERWNSLDDLLNDIAAEEPALGGIARVAPPAGFRAAGRRIPRQPHRYSGRTSMKANIDVHEMKPAEDRDSPLSFSMEGYRGMPPSPLVPFFWAPGWNSAQSINKFQEEIGGRLRGGDPGVRIIEPAHGYDFSGRVPAAEDQHAGQWLLVPSPEVFGSEELSALSPPIAELVPVPHLLVNEADLAQAGLEDGSKVRLILPGMVIEIAVKSRDGCPRGVAGYPLGLPGAAYIDLPVRATVEVK